MIDKTKMINKKIFIKIFFIFILFSSYIFYAAYDDKKDNVPDSIEKIIPQSVKNFILNNIFVKKRLNNTIKRLQQRVNNKDKELKSENRIVDKLLNDLYLMIK